jgi:hypothetical protein
MIIAMLIGLFCMTPGIFDMTEDHHTMIYSTYCIGIIIWSTVFVELWKKRQFI